MKRFFFYSCALSHFVHIMKYLSFIFFLFFVNVTFAQANKESCSFVRLNGTANFFSSDKYRASSYENNGTLGFSLDLGGKQFLGQSNIFLEEIFSFAFSELPFPKYPSWDGGYNPYPLGDNLSGRETGIGTIFICGYRIPLKKEMSLDLFGGPNLKYSYKFSGGYHSFKEYLNKVSLRLNAGVSLNINNFNVYLFASPDLLDRGIGTFKYKTVQVGLGVGYYFKWKNVWRYILTEH